MFVILAKHKPPIACQNSFTCNCVVLLATIQIRVWNIATVFSLLSITHCFPFVKKNSHKMTILTQHLRKGDLCKRKNPFLYGNNFCSKVSLFLRKQVTWKFFFIKWKSPRWTDFSPIHSIRTWMHLMQSQHWQ